MTSVKKGQAVKVKLWGGAQWLSAKVNEIAASADPVTRTFTVKVALDNLKIPLGTTGATVFLSAPAGLEAMTLPTSAVWLAAGKTSVWTVDPASMKVRAQVVQVSGVHDNQVISSSGLEPGQQVVTAGVHVLSGGQRVTYYKAAGEQP